MTKQLSIVAEWTGPGNLPDIDPDLLCSEVIGYVDGMLLELVESPGKVALVRIDFTSLVESMKPDPS